MDKKRVLAVEVTKLLDSKKNIVIKELSIVGKGVRCCFFFNLPEHFEQDQDFPYCSWYYSRNHHLYTDNEDFLPQNHVTPIIKQLCESTTIVINDTFGHVRDFLKSILSDVDFIIPQTDKELWKMTEIVEELEKDLDVDCYFPHYTDSEGRTYCCLKTATALFKYYEKMEAKKPFYDSKKQKQQEEEEKKPSETVKRSKKPKAGKPSAKRPRKKKHLNLEEIQTNHQSSREIT